MKVVVTGGAGFIGSHLAEALVGQGDNVVVLDNFSAGKEAHLSAVKDKISVIKGDIRDLDLLKSSFKDVEVVFHQAALRYVTTSVEQPHAYNDVNINGTLNVLEAARLSGVKTVVFASSSSVYGEDPKLPQREGREDVRLSPYAITKFAGEDYCRYFHRLYGLNTVCLRYFNVFGPRQDPFAQYAAVIPKFALCVLKGEQPPIFGSGEQSRDFTFVKDVVAANLCAAKAKRVGGKEFNVASGSPVTVNVLAQKISQILASTVQANYHPARPGDVLYSYADMSRSRKMLKLPVFTPFDDALKVTVEWFRDCTR